MFSNHWSASKTCTNSFLLSETLLVSYQLKLKLAISALPKTPPYLLHAFDVDKE